jgi:hypothetical protein
VENLASGNKCIIQGINCTSKFLPSLSREKAFQPEKGIDIDAMILF